jgi:DNA-directed RNA polymerase subunit RPC12/RpoP
MADMKFSCSHCGQQIECDELWSGHEIQCPTCHGQLMVPPKPDAPPHVTLASAKPNQPRLSIGQSRDQRSAAPPPPAPQMATLQQQLNQARLAKKGNPMKWVAAGAVVVILGVGGYLAYGPVSAWWAKRSEAAKQASAPPPDTNAPPPELPPPPKELPVLPAVWTLDVDQAKIPEGKANGTLAGTNFMVETAICVPQLLRLSQGAAGAPDHEIQIFLRLSTSDSLSGHSWTVKTNDPAGKDVPQVVVRWKPNPRSATQTKSYSSRYAMKLELGDLQTNQITGKIFLALPDPDQSVVAGVFKAMTASANPNPAANAFPGMMPGPGAAPMAPMGPGRMGPPGADRYGGRKR